MRSIKIKIDGRDVELYFSTRAMINISERCGGNIENLSEYLSEGNTTDKIKKISLILADLANGAIVKHNADVVLGLETGEKRPLYDDNYFIDVLNPAELMAYKDAIFETLGMGTAYEIPEGVKLEEKDADLEEIMAEKEKNVRGA